MIKDEFNQQPNENFEVKESNTPKEFSHPKEYTGYEEFEKVEEIHSNQPKTQKTPTVLTKIPVCIFVGAVAGGALIVTSAVEVMNEGKSEIAISQVGENYVSFDYKTQTEGLVLRIHNDFENVEKEIEYINPDEEGFYSGSYTFESLKANTSYTVSIDGDNRFGSTSRASKQIRTLQREYYGEFSVDDSSIYIDGNVNISVKSLNVELKDDDVLSFNVVDNKGETILDKYVIDHNEVIFSAKSLQIGEKVSELQGFYTFSISNVDEEKELFRQSFSYGKIDLDSWKKEIKVNYDYKLLNESKLMVNVTFSGLEVESTNFKFTLTNSQTNVVVDTQTFETYLSPFSIDLTKIMDIRKFGLKLTAEVKGKEEEIINASQNLDEVLTRPEDITANVDTSEVMQTNILYVTLNYADVVNYYKNFSGSLDYRGTTITIPFTETNLHDRIAVPLDAFGYITSAYCNIELEYEGTTYTIYAEDIDITSEAWKNKVVVNYNYNDLSSGTLKCSVTFDGLETSAANYKFTAKKYESDDIIAISEYQTYETEFEIHTLEEGIAENKFRLILTAEVLGVNQIIFDEIVDLSPILTPIEDIQVELDNSSANTTLQSRIKLNYIDTYNVYALEAYLVSQSQASDVYIFNSEHNIVDYHDWGTAYLEACSSSPETECELHVNLYVGNMFFNVRNTNIMVFHTSTPEELEIVPEFHSSMAQSSKIRLNHFFDLDNSYGEITYTISDESEQIVNTDTYSPQSYSETIDVTRMISAFSQYSRVKLIVLIEYNGQSVELYNAFVSLI